MAATLTSYAMPGSKNRDKIAVAAKYAGVQIKEVDFFPDGKANRTADFLQKSPTGKVPVLETPHGSIWESNAIARYVARLSDNSLLGSTALETARIEQWIDFSTLSLDNPLQSWTYPLLFPQSFPYNRAKEDEAIKAVKAGLEILNKHLNSNTFLVGDTVTLADVIAWSSLKNGYKNVFDEKFRSQFAAVTRWYVTLANQPNFKAAGVTLDLCTTPIKFTPPPKEAKKPKEAAAPKAEAAAAVKPATPAQEEEAPKPAAKPKDPLMELPPSKMVLDSWKRLYSNTPASNFSHCLKGLWSGADIPNSPTNEHFEGFDADGFSIYFIDYKYDDENTVNFIVMNKVGGFLQRIDYVRKHAFAAICILKDPAKNIFPIRGLFIFRGQDIPPIMKDECYDVDLYNWTKVDTTDAKQRQRVEAILGEEATIDGLENVEVKVFK